MSERITFDKLITGSLEVLIHALQCSLHEFKFIMDQMCCLVATCLSSMHSMDV